MGNLFANGKLRPAAFPSSTTSLNESSPELATDRPYAVDLTGWFEGYTHPAANDANGGASRIATVVALESIQNGLTGLIPTGVAGFLQTFLGKGAPGGQLADHDRSRDRCPGSMERGAVYYPESGLPLHPERGADGVMKRILVSAAILVAVGASWCRPRSLDGSPVGTYKIELDNAFGLVTGADFKVAGVPAGKIGNIDLTPGCIKGGGSTSCYALVTVDVTQKGFGEFHSDAFCQSRPQSLIGEYFIECTPGTKGKVLKPGSTIPCRTRSRPSPATCSRTSCRCPTASASR